MPAPTSWVPGRHSPTIAIKEDGGRFALEGALDIRTLREAANSLNAWQRERKSRTLDLRNLSSLDTPGALLLCNLQQHGVELTGIRNEHKSLLDLICGLERKPLPPQPAVSRGRQLVIELGKGADNAWRDTLEIITFVGRAASAIGQAFLHVHSLRLPSISRHIDETGIHALPIV